MSQHESVATMFLERVGKTPEREAFRYPTPEGAWRSMSWKQTGERVRAIACGLRSLGIADEERVTILAGTRIEWILADLAILAAAGATTTIYPSNTPDECAYILEDSGTVMIFAEDEKQVKKLRQKRSELKNVKKVIVFDKAEAAQGEEDWLLSLAALEEAGKKWDAENPGEFERIANGVTKDKLATLIYTSGTTGKPKGVELIHDTWLFQAEAIDALELLREEDVQYFWLPLAHVFGKVLEVAQLRIGFATAIDGRVDKIVENLAIVKPTFVAAVPRIFEKVYNTVIGGGKGGGAVKKAIFEWAVGVGKAASREQQAGREPGGFLALQHRLADKLVFSKLKDRFGGKLRYFVSGSAPLNRDIAEFFHAFGLLILEGYGLTEASASDFVNRPGKYKIGTVGLALPGMEYKIAESDGEILLKGRAVMRGYHNMPDATAEVIDKEGWFHTGDIGEVDSEGFLKITDRKKDLIKTSGGKYIAPQLLEGKLKTLTPLLSQIVIHGDTRNFVSALVTLDEPELKKFASGHGLSGDYKKLTQEKTVREELQRAFDTLNKGLPSYSTVKKFAVLEQDFTVETGELTASMKVRRKIVEKNHAKTLDDFYKDALAS